MVRIRQSVIDALKKKNSLKVDHRGYLDKISENLIHGINLVDFESDLTQGSGNELTKKFLAIHSSSALVVNHFAFFKNNIKKLKLFSYSNFSFLKFEGKLPIGLKGTPPNLDVLIKSDSELIGIESKFLEYTEKKKVKFSDSYFKEDRLPYLGNKWFDLIKKYQDMSMHLDVAQLIKHSIGLMKNKEDKRAILIYIFWEPENYHEIDLYKIHRDELDRFSEDMSFFDITFHWYSYKCLWDFWDKYSETNQLSKNLRDRYSIKL
jgi:hypothetical protein